MTYELPRSFRVEELCEHLNVSYEGAEIAEVFCVGPLNGTELGCLTFYSGNAETAKDALAGVAAGSVVCSTAAVMLACGRTDIGYMISDGPRFLFIRSVDFMMHGNEYQIEGISSLASIHESVELGKDVAVGPFVTIRSGAKLGDNCVVESGSFIGPNVILQEDVRVGPNTTIGVSGQASEKDATNKHISLHHFGSIVVGKNTRIGSNSVLVSGSLQDTLIGKRCTIGHQVSVGHNCSVGDNCFISAGVTIGGSVKVGEGTWIAPGSTILNKVKIGSSVIVGLGSVVSKNVTDDKFIVGNPAREIRQTDPTRYNKANV